MVCPKGVGGAETSTGEVSEIPVPIRVTVKTASSQMRLLFESNQRAYLPIPQLLSIFAKYFWKRPAQEVVLEFPEAGVRELKLAILLQSATPVLLHH